MASGSETQMHEDMRYHSDEDEDEMWEDDDNDEDDEEEEEGMLSGPVKCLFCDSVFLSVREVFDHCRDNHQFDISQVAKLWRLDCIGYIKMINYIRKQRPSPSSLRDIHPPFPWDSDDFMQPTNPEDLLLQYDIESQGSGEDMPCVDQGEATPEERAAAAEARAQQAEEELRRAVADLETIRSFMKTFMSSEADVTVADTPPSIQSLNVKEDEAYFSSYSHYGIHREMLEDKVRTESYRDVILKNKSLFAGKVVLDVGCGTGILSMFAAQAGASLVIGVDQSDIIYRAMDIVRENNLDKQITLVKGRLEDVKLPVEKVDIIISEWMGYFLLFESMLDTVLYARDRYLKDDGIVFPDRCTISLVGSGERGLYDKHVSFWEDVYGFNMSCMKAEVIPEASVEIVKPSMCITEPSVVKELDVCRCRLDDLQFEAPFLLRVIKDGCLSALVGFFDIFFEKGCDTKVSFSTSPAHKATHWSQTVFLLKKPRQIRKVDMIDWFPGLVGSIFTYMSMCNQNMETVFRSVKGETLDGKLTCRKNRKDPRSLLVTIVLAGVRQEYFME